MIEIKMSDYEKARSICSQNDIEYNCNIMLYTATDTNLEDVNELCYCLFEVKGVSSQILKLHIQSQDMLPIADGVLRATINCLLDHSIKKAVYKGSDFLNLFSKLGFKEQDCIYSVDISEDIFRSFGN
jgi:hypothetical protein